MGVDNIIYKPNGDEGEFNYKAEGVEFGIIGINGNKVKYWSGVTGEVLTSTFERWGQTLILKD